MAEKGFTIIEVILVISLMILLYSVALPNLSLKSGTEASIKMGQLASDIRAAYDMAVLNRKPYRLVFHMLSGDYWLESTEKTNFYLGDAKVGRDPTPEEDKIALNDFETAFKEFEQLAGQDIDDPDCERVIKPTSPIIKAKDVLRPTKWSKIGNQEWQKRSFSPFYLIQDMQAEHHSQKQALSSSDENSVVMLYFFPDGYVEKAVFHIGQRKGEREINDSVPPYTVVTNPYVGTAQIISGYEEFEINEESK
ncbi:MAG: type II secretion system protein [Oligoflexales bacterium]|nr:type II secretion system protein [Oligoflexales bacterium]